MLIPLKWWKIKWKCKVKILQRWKTLCGHFFLHASLPKQHYRQITPNCCPQNSKLTQWRITPSVMDSQKVLGLWLNIYLSSQKTTSQDGMFPQLLGSACTLPPLLPATWFSARVPPQGGRPYCPNHPPLAMDLGLCLCPPCRLVPNACPVSENIRQDQLSGTNAKWNWFFIFRN